MCTYILKFKKISQVGAELYYVGGRTGRRGKKEKKLEVALLDSLAKASKMDNLIILNYYNTFIT